MPTILKFINTPIVPTRTNFVWYIVTLVLSNIFFHLIYLNVFLSVLFWKIKFVPKIIKIISITGLTMMMLIFNVIQLLTYFNLQLDPGTNSNLLNIVQLIEGLHILVFAGFFYCIFNIIFVKNSPFSLIYAGMYQLVHVILKKCPIISLQNFINPGAGNSPFKNEFWQGFFGDYTQLMRVVIGLLTIAMFYTAYIQLKKVNYKFWYLDTYFPWKDYELNQPKKAKSALQ